MMAVVRGAATSVALALTLGLPAIAHADNFNVPSGRLGEVASALGLQAGVTITVTEPDVADLHSPGVTGEFSLRDALTRALRGTGAEAVFYDGATIRVVRTHVPASQPMPPAPAPAAIEPPTEILVTASKQNLLLNSYPGSVKIIPFEPGSLADQAAQGTSALTERLPILGSTNLGPGRDKLFIRGIADSSFNGPTQATVGEYLGNVRLNYNAPDPDLNLYDMSRVEVLVGPQGTLYGAGSLGGVVRLVPNEPQFDATAISTSTGFSSTRYGANSLDSAAMFNAPLLPDRAAFRMVVYGTRDGGYIDDPAHEAHDINSSASYGQRSILRLQGIANFTLDLGFVLQNINSADAQYTLRSAALTRSTVTPQPFRNNYRVAYLTAQRPVGTAELVSTTSFVWHGLQTVFDATGYDGTRTPSRFEEHNNITLISHETRIAGGVARSSWVGGISGLFNVSQLSRTLGPLQAPVQIAGVINFQGEAALFGQLSYPFMRSLTGTIGGRVTFANSTGIPIDALTTGSPTFSRDSVRYSNTVALDWHPGGDWSAFVHTQQGDRAGGLAVEPANGGLESRRFAADALNMQEIGLRLGHAPDEPWSVRAALFATDWKDMQADLVDSAGLPYTTNIGHGKIYGIDTDIDWRISPAFTLSGTFYFNDSTLVTPTPPFETTRVQTLPSVARDGGRLVARWHQPIAPGTFSAEASVRYVGKSMLGVGPVLAIPQGNYAVVDAAGHFDFGRFSLSLNLDNIGDVRANTFAFGNPFGVAQRDQMTPLRPRTLRLGLSMQLGGHNSESQTAGSRPSS